MNSSLGRRIAIYGATGAGKTTLARRLGEILGLGVIEMDSIRHERGWDSTPMEDFGDRVGGLIKGFEQGWVCDGNYRTVGVLVDAEADTAIWLHLPWRTSFSRLLKRTVARSWSKEPLYNPAGPRESWRLSFLSRNSILWWSVHHHQATVRHTRERIASLPSSVAVFELRSTRDVEALLITAREQRAQEVSAND